MLNILYASITGGIMILLWYLSYPLSRKYFKASWHYSILKTAMVFLVLPIPALTRLFSGFSASVNSFPYVSVLSEQIQTLNISESAIHSVNAALSDIVFFGEPLPPIQAGSNEISGAAIPYLQIVWLLTAVILFAGGTWKMVRTKNQITRFCGHSADSETGALFLQCKAQFKVRGSIALRTSRYIKTPLVFGLIRPTIVLPETDMNAEEKRLALTHELMHIKTGDLWIKLFAFVICAVHWFNPLAHLLRRKILSIHEEYCDECVVKAMSKEERLGYANLILKTVTVTAVPQTVFCSTLSTSIKNMKRRLTNMMNVKKLRKSMVALSIVAALLLCAPAVIYTLAANTASSSGSESKTIVDSISTLPALVNNIASSIKENPALPSTEPAGLPEPESKFEDWIGSPEKDLNYWNMFACTRTATFNHDDSPITFTFKNGTTIETKNLFREASMRTSMNGEQPHFYLEPYRDMTIMFANGITITAPARTTVKATPVENADHLLEITISGEAAMTKPDGTSSVLTNGTVLDGEGNILSIE